MPKEVSYKNLLIFKCYLKKAILEESKNMTFLVSNRNYLMTFIGALSWVQVETYTLDENYFNEDF